MWHCIMKKINKFGRVLSKKEQKDVKGGNPNVTFTMEDGTITVNCFVFLTYEITCETGEHAIINGVDGSIKCCSYATGACRHKKVPCLMQQGFIIHDYHVG
jgi:hypothetical protein